jgi:hypothetical protein
MIPTVDVDLYSEANLANPYPAYTAIRDAGPVCRLGDSDLLVIGRGLRWPTGKRSVPVPA